MVSERLSSNSEYDAFDVSRDRVVAVVIVVAVERLLHSLRF